MKRLTELTPHEVSMVKKGANKKRFLVLKKDMPAALQEDTVKSIVDAEPDVMEKIDGIIKDHNAGYLGHGDAEQEGEMGEGVEKDDLTTEGRKHIKDSNFALPQERKYPIHDLAHARNALARVAQHGTPEEQKKVRAAVHRKYPNLGSSEKAYDKKTVSPGKFSPGEKVKPINQGKPDEDETGFNEPFNDDEIAAIVKDGTGCVEKAAISQDQDEQQGPLDEQSQAALKAIVRILRPQKDKLSPMVIHQVLDAAGFQLAEQPDGGTMQKTDRQSPEKVLEEHEMAAKSVAKKAAAKAYKEHLEKLGYKKYPDAEMTQKAVDHDPDQPAQDEMQDGTMHNPDAKEEGKTTMHKKVSKSLDLSGLPKEARRPVEAIFKAHEELVEKSEAQGREIEALRRREQKRDLIAKADNYQHLGVNAEEFADTMLDLKASAPEQFEKIEKILKTANEQVKSGKLFSEFGSSRSGAAGTTWEKIEQAASAFVQKSGEKLTLAQSVDRYLQTQEGRLMYEDYMNDHVSRKG